MDLIEKYLGEAVTSVTAKNLKKGMTIRKFGKIDDISKQNHIIIVYSGRSKKMYDELESVTIVNEAVVAGFARRLPSKPSSSGGGKKKQLSAADWALLKSRGKIKGSSFKTSRGETNLSNTPERPEPSNKGKSKLKKAMEDAPVKVGDIFYNSWGYDQTNIDWYQVVSVSPTGKTCKIREIQANVKDTGNMTGETTPIPNKFKGPAKQKKIRVSGSEVNLPMEFGWCPKWDGRPKHSSWYH